MGYSLSKHSIIRNLPQLRQLAKARSTLRFPTDNPKKLAYKLREAVASCDTVEEYKEMYEELRNYRFKEVDHAVVAEYFNVTTKGEAVLEPLEPIQQQQETTPRAVPEKKVLAGVFGLMDVLATSLKFGNEQELYFPDAALLSEDKMKLYTYCEPLEWSYIDHTQGGGSGLTLTKKELPEGVAWQPDSGDQSK